MKRSLIIALGLLAATAASASAAAITVTPSTGPLGTSFTISFVAPAAQAAGYYSVQARAADAHGGSCVPKLSFSNPRAVSAGLKIRFTFRPTGVEQLCPGSWSVTVSNPSGAVLLSGGQFTLGKSGANTPSRPKPNNTPTTPSKTPTTPSTPVATGGAIHVTPSSGALGTTFTISFATPAVEAAGALTVRASASSTHGGSCVSHLSFRNPRAAGANVTIKFAFTPAAAEQLCSGPWSVSVSNSATSQTLLSGGSFTLA